EFRRVLFRSKRIKQVMQSLGIKSIDDLGTLKLEGNKSIKPGDVLIGKKKYNMEDVWHNWAVTFNSASITSKVDILNNNLGNAKSFNHFEIRSEEHTSELQSREKRV